jgi:hypothetical protein
MYTLSLRNKKDVPVADIRMESVYCIDFHKKHILDIRMESVLRVVTLRHFEFSKTRTKNNIESNKWADLQKPAVPFKVTVRAVLDVRYMYFCSFFDSFEVWLGRPRLRNYVDSPGRVGGGGRGCPEARSIL